MGEYPLKLPYDIPLENSPQQPIMQLKFYLVNDFSPALGSVVEPVNMLPDFEPA